MDLRIRKDDKIHKSTLATQTPKENGLGGRYECWLKL
jgi:hypothetical protein